MNEKILYFKSWLANKYINLRGNKHYAFKNILIIKLDEIGDLVTSLHVFYNLNQQYPEAKIDLYCKSFNNIFFQHVPFVTCINDDTNIKGKYDLIVELRGDDKTLSYSLKNRPKYRVDRGSIRFKNKFFGGQKNEIDTNFEVIKPLIDQDGSLDNKIVLSEAERATVNNFISTENIAPFAIMHLGARDEIRRWPVERFAECIAYLNTNYSIPCVLVGGPEDNDLNKHCLSLVKSKRNVNVVGQFNLLEYAALCERASLFIGNESGPVHIAAAQNTPIIALFGPGVKDVFYPKGSQVKIHHYFLANGHKKQTMNNSTIFSITVEEVKTSIDQMLAKK